MEVIEVLRNISKQVYDNVKNLAGTEDAAGDFGRGAGGDILNKFSPLSSHCQPVTDLYSKSIRNHSTSLQFLKFCLHP